jgi:asparagine synthase (glutamine-hydrolysing)
VGKSADQQLKETFIRVLPRYLAGAQPIGMSLTGGLDGRMILACAKPTVRTLPCYTFGGSYRESTDVAVAREVARVCQHPHTVLPVDGEFLREFPKHAEGAVYISDGTIDVTGSVELYVNRKARDIAPIRLTGNYGSEVVRGNIAFRPQRLNEAIYQPEFLRLAHNATATYEHEAECRRLSFIAFKQVPWHHYSRLSIEESQLTTRTPFLDNELISLQYQVPPLLATSNQPSLRLVAENNPALGRIATDRGLLYRPQRLIGATRQMYEQFRAKAEYAYDYGMPQWLAKFDHRLARLRLERLFLGHHKFYHFRVWYRDQLSRYVKDVVLDPRTRSRPYLRGERLEAMVKNHLEGKANYTSEITQVLSCELIQRELIERN